MTSDPPRPTAPLRQIALPDPVESGRMSFGDHLDELRRCLIRALIGIALGTVVTLIYGQEILEIIYVPLLKVQFANGLQPSVQVLSPTGAFSAYLKIGFLSGLLVTMPWVLYQVWLFVATGLYPRERKFIKLVMPASLGLFVVGVLFLYVVVLPMVLQFFVGFNMEFKAPDLTPTAFQSLFLPREAPHSPSESNDRLKIPFRVDDPPDARDGDAWVNAKIRRLMFKTPGGVWSAPLEPTATGSAMHSEFALDAYISFVLSLALAFGLTFETPIVVFFLARTGIVPIATMVGARRYVILGVVFLAAILTPPDVVSQMMLAIPMYALFELGILTAKLTQRRAANRSDEPAISP